MAYTRPGVYVYQNFTETPVVNEMPPRFVSAVLGTCYPIVEGDDGLVTTAANPFQPTSSGTDKVNYTLPGFDMVFDTLATTDFKVFLAPVGGLEPIRLNYFTKQYLEGMGISYPYLGRVADITAACTYNENSAKGVIEVSRNISSGLYTAYNGFGTIDINKTYRVYVAYRAHRKPTALVTETFTQVGLKNLKLKYTIDSAGTVTVKNGESTLNTSEYQVNRDAGLIILNTAIALTETITVEYTAVNPIYQSRVKVTGLGDVQKYFGKPHPLNPIAMGLSLALQTANSALYGIAVRPFTTGVTKVNTTDLATALEKINTKEVYSIAVMDSATNVGSTVNDFVHAASEPNKSNFKIAMLGFDYTDSTETVSDLRAKAIAYENPRIRLLANKIIYVSSDIEGGFPLNGYYYSAIYAGQVQSLMQTAPQRSLTNSMPPLLVDARFKLFSDPHFTDDELGQLADAGLWVLVKELDKVLVMHQLTTAESNYSTREDSVIRALDYFTATLKEKSISLIANSTVTQKWIDNIFKPLINETIKQLVDSGVASEGTRVESIVNPAPDTVSLNIRFVAPYPLNIIKIYITI